MTSVGGVDRVDISSLTDDELWDGMKALARNERTALSDFVEHLAEIDRRGLPTERGFRSLFEYCVHHRGCSEPAAYRRIRGARAIRRFPPIGQALRDGRLSLEAVVILHPFLADDDAAALVKNAFGLKVWQVQALVAGRQPDAPRRDVIRLCPPTGPRDQPVPTLTEPALAFAATSKERTPPEHAPLPAAPSLPRPAPSIRVAFTADDEFHKLMLRARALLRHKYPDGRLEGVLKDALIALLKRRDRGFRWGPGG